MIPELHHETPLEIVATLYHLFNEGRLDEKFDLMAPEVVVNEPGDAAHIPWAGEFRGHDGLRRFYDGLAEALSTIEIEPGSLELLPVGNEQVLALGTEGGISAKTGRSYVTRSVWLWTVREGGIGELTAFHDTAAMEAALRS
jgi:ketosteroid isomerase-like protein